ncbi:MAG TPA: efflux RND transporter periplasmic adaptor subunit [Alphaproteobacteria bacterium]|jgi:membrane fusion protein (multidrug efflux system)|nr:efflux RND transporter periplasmic adaptor subunit [Alphaproteobacteria bacterium]
MTMHDYRQDYDRRPRRRFLNLRMIIMLVLVAVVLGGVFGYSAVRGYMIKKFMASMGAPPQTVSTMKAEISEWQQQMRAVGSLRAVRGADLSAQVAGIVSAVHFESGAEVQEGALLVELMAADDIAKLNALKASAALARITRDRNLAQFKAQAVSKQQVDADEQNLKSAEAQVAQQEALVNYKSIRAPFAGQLGIRLVDIGQYLSAGTAVVTLQSLDPIFFDFYMPQQALDVLKTGLPVTVETDTYPGITFTGSVLAINPKVDPDTRNVQVRATLSNPEHKLLPGMYANVTLRFGEPQPYVTVPQTAISYNPYGNLVYVVDNQGNDQSGKPKLVATQKFVTLGETRGDQVAILTGIDDGQEIVTNGLNKLRNGIPVVVNNSVQPSNDANPTPPNE